MVTWEIDMKLFKFHSPVCPVTIITIVLNLLFKRGTVQSFRSWWRQALRPMWAEMISAAENLSSVWAWWCTPVLQSLGYIRKEGRRERGGKKGGKLSLQMNTCCRLLIKYNWAFSKLTSPFTHYLLKHEY